MTGRHGMLGMIGMLSPAIYIESAKSSRAWLNPCRPCRPCRPRPLRKPPASGKKIPSANPRHSSSPAPAETSHCRVTNARQMTLENHHCLSAKHPILLAKIGRFGL